MTGTTSQTAGNADGTGSAPPQPLAGRVRRSFADSSGSIVFGRARIGRRQVLPTVAQTVGIATAAAVAGLLVGKLIS